MTSFAAPYRRAPGLLLIALLHLGLVHVLLQSRRQPANDDAPRGPAIQWLRQVAPLPVRPRAVPVPRRAERPIIVRRAAPPAMSRPAPPAPIQVPLPARQEAAPALPPAADAAMPARPGAADILAQAKRDVGKIDKDLRKEFPQGGGQKFEDTAFKRMQQGFADAYAAVPPKWYEASRIEEISADAKSGTRVYKITSALGSICVSSIPGRGGETTLTLCPPK